MDLTCGFSGLAIEPGSSVRYVPMTRHWAAKDTATAVHAFDEWVIRAPALRGAYADSGNLDVDLRKSAATAAAIEYGFSLDTHVVGPGPNQYHDLPMTRGMSLDAILRRIDSGLMVDQEQQTPGSQVFLQEVQMHVAVWKLSIAEGHSEAAAIDFRARNEGPWRVVIDMNRSDYLAIQDPWSLVESLKTYLAERYGVVITPPSDLNTTPELQVFPKWTQEVEQQTLATKSTKSLCYTAPIKSRESPPLAVRALWVREDVWQACLETRLDLDYKTPNVSFDQVAQNFHSELRALVQIQQRDRAPGRKWYETQNERNDRVRALRSTEVGLLTGILYDRRSFAGELSTIGLTDHVTWAVNMFLDGKLHQEQLEQIVLDTAEAVWVSRVMDHARRWVCRPSNAGGSGHDRYRTAQQLLSAFARLAQENVARIEAEQTALDIEDGETV